MIEIWASNYKVGKVTKFFHTMEKFFQAVERFFQTVERFFQCSLTILVDYLEPYSR